MIAKLFDTIFLKTQRNCCSTGGAQDPSVVLALAGSDNHRSSRAARARMSDSNNQSYVQPLIEPYDEA